MGWATIWATLSQTHPVTLVASYNVPALRPSSSLFALLGAFTFNGFKLA
jgi:hypothetical protein